MECPKCHTESPDSAKFCMGCGSPLQLRCPQCAQALPPGAAFCTQCGFRLAPGGAEAAGTTSPARPTEGDGPSVGAEGERRQVTIVFSDLSGYTAMNERLDPEEVESLMRRLKAQANEIITRHGGIINQFVGDEVVALFGVTSAHEDDPVRAVRAAQELHSAVRATSPDVEQRVGQPLRMHTGINTGLVLAQARDSRDGTYGITGDTINTGARLAAIAGADVILAGPDTQRLIAPYFDMEVLEPVELKGKAHRITPYRIAGTSKAKSRFEAALLRGLTRYVGREEELHALSESFERAGRGQGEVVCVVGEAGLGKSRLIHEFRQLLPQERSNLVLGRCTLDGANWAYFPFLDLLKRWFGFAETDGPAQMLAKARGIVLALDPALEPHLPAVLHLLSIPGALALPEGIAPEAVQRKVMDALKALLDAASRERPVVMILEDLHWIDPASEAVLEQYVQAAANRKVLLLASFRPEYRPKWGHYGHVVTVGLKPVGVQATADMLASRIGVVQVPEELAALVHAKTEGNPFFTEELALAMLEEGSVRREAGRTVLARPAAELHLPDTVQAVVRSRLDRLEESQREVLRLASVVGREFTETLLIRLQDGDSGLPEHLLDLKRLELILEKSLHPELAFMFKHAITHEVVYQSLLLRRRKTLHRLVGLCIEELYAARLPEFYEMLAHHFDQGEVWDKAVIYLVHAGAKARRNQVVTVAMRQLGRAQEILDAQAPEVSWQVRYNLHFERGQAYGDLAQLVFSKDELKRAAELARGRDDTAHFAAGANYIWMASMAGAFDEAMSAADAMEADLKDKPELRVVLLANSVLISVVRGRLDRVLRDEARFKTLQSHLSSSPLAALAGFPLGLITRWRGDFAQCEQVLKPLLVQMKDTATADAYLHIVFFYALSVGEQGRLQEAKRLLEDGLEYCERVGERYARPKLKNCLAWVYRELGQPDAAIRYNSQALHDVQQAIGPGTTHLFEVIGQSRVDLAEGHLQQDEPDAALEQLDIVYGKRDEPDYEFARNRWMARCMLTLGEVWLRKGDCAQARRYLGELGENAWVERYPFKKYQVRSGRLLGRLLAAEGKPAEAESALRQALDKAVQVGNPTQLWKTHQALGDLYQRMERSAEAQLQFRRAYEVVRGIADGLDEPALKQGFLDSPTIRSLAAQAGPA